ncbi:hypothetical protein GCM10009609_44680 [Pseudonocardia aurantiaca]|uniref:Uncharacterized protein n=1 Tax=Pseudonocardia aurantiaca TaxID=75290 RepID=A0ABW4FFZ2_9PSEU
MSGLDLLADRVQRNVLILRAGRRSDAAGEHAGVAAQQHAQRPAEHPDQHADQAAARDCDAGGDVISFGPTHRAVGSPLQQRGRPDLHPSRIARLPQLAQRLVGLALVGESDDHDVLIHLDLPLVCDEQARASV